MLWIDIILKWLAYSSSDNLLKMCMVIVFISLNCILSLSCIYLVTVKMKQFRYYISFFPYGSGSWQKLTLFTVQQMKAHTHMHALIFKVIRLHVQNRSRQKEQQTKVFRRTNETRSFERHSSPLDGSLSMAIWAEIISSSFTVLSKVTSSPESERHLAP